MVICEQNDGHGRCKLNKGTCGAAVPHALASAVGKLWIDAVTGRYICGNNEAGHPLNVEDTDLSPQEDKEA